MIRAAIEVLGNFPSISGTIRHDANSTKKLWPIHLLPKSVKGRNIWKLMKTRLISYVITFAAGVAIGFVLWIAWSRHEEPRYEFRIQSGVWRFDKHTGKAWRQIDGFWQEIPEKSGSLIAVTTPAGTNTGTRTDVEIEGIGIVTFPPNWSEDQIYHAIENGFVSTNRPVK